ncbi:MAG: PF20097 family protein [Planctomycetota bacterium]
MTCPKCDKKMSHGYIAGHWIRLRWVDKPNTKTIFSGNVLRKNINWWTAPNLEAVRCEDCKIGVFRYDY